MDTQISRSDLRRYQKNFQDEMDNVFLYGQMAKAEKNPELSEVFRRLALTEQHHANFWKSKIIKGGGAGDMTLKPSLRARMLQQISKVLGTSFVLSAVTANEVRAQRSYDSQSEADGTGMAGEERSHARVLSAMSHIRSGVDGGVLASMEGRHGAVRGNALRAAVLGVNDGMVSNLSLIMGVAGAKLSEHGVLVAGVAGLLAGACSMAMGEWLSVQNARELHMSQMEAEAEELEANPKEEQEELALIYQSKGIKREDAQRMAASIMQDKTIALQTLAREELGIDPDELGGSAHEAAITSFFLFVIGAIIPLIPFFFIKGPMVVIASLVSGAAGLLFTGMLIAFFTGRPALSSGIRQLLFGLVAAGITFGIGHLFGVVIGG
jgi:VIT1/CCC1 family predicted Fe2+/Mn2+ transporter